MNKRILFPILIFAFCAAGLAQDAKNLPKLTVDEIVSKHLASIGTPEAIAAAKSRVVMGRVSLTSKIGYVGSLSGAVQLASEGNKTLFAMIFNSNDYPYEKVAFDGKDQTIALPNGARTSFNEFLKTKSPMIKDGLLNGVLSSNWVLLDVKGRNAKLEYAGTGMAGNRPVYKLKYSPKGGDLKITLFFDAQTFQHVMTEYKYTVDPRIGASSTDIQGQPDYYNFTEQFADFKKAGDLVLPFSYQITVDVQRNRTTSIQNGQTPIGTGSETFTMNLSDVYYNQPLEASAFKVS